MNGSVREPVMAAGTRRHERASDARLSIEQLVERYLPLAEKVARRYRRSTEPLDDLVQVARIGLLKAATRWDPARGLVFSTYAVPTMMGELRRYFRDSTWAVRPPRGLQELCLDVERIRDPLAQELGREPSATDVAVALGRDVEDVVEALTAASAYQARSLDVPAHDGEGDGLPRRDLVVDRRSDLRRCEDAMTFDQLLLIFDERDREIVRLRFRDDLIQREIADRVGCSQMQVSRVLRDAVRRMEMAAGQP